MILLPTAILKLDSSYRVASMVALFVMDADSTVVGNHRSERKELARRAALIQGGGGAVGDKGIQMETFSGVTLRRWTWGGVQAF